MMVPRAWVAMILRLSDPVLQSHGVTITGISDTGLESNCTWPGHCAPMSRCQPKSSRATPQVCAHRRSQGAVSKLSISESIHSGIMVEE
jgi:hypothetical protein